MVAGLSGADGDAVLRKEVQRTPADATGNHDLRALLVEPARNARCGGAVTVPECDVAFGRNGLYEGKPGACTKMFMEAAFGCWNGDGHR